MRMLRHLLALAIVAGFYFLYQEKQKLVHSPATSSAPFDPFATWDQNPYAPGAADAPRFGDTPLPPREVPRPIPFPFPVAGNPQIPSEYIGWEETGTGIPTGPAKLEQPVTPKSTPPSTQTSSSPQSQSLTQSKSTPAVTTQPADQPAAKPAVKPTGSSLWEEPAVVPRQPATSRGTASPTNTHSQQPQTPQPSDKQPQSQSQSPSATPPKTEPKTESLTSTKPAAASPTEKSAPAITEAAPKEKSPAANTSPAKNPATGTNPASTTTASPAQNTQTPAATAATPAAYRQFGLGAGSRKTVCVIEDSVSQDGLLISTLFAGLRREWISDVKRSREQTLVLLVADHQQKLPTNTKQQQLQTKIAELSPERVVYVNRGQETRGKLTFSSDQESIAALVSVPGIYKITADPPATGAAQATEKTRTAGERQTVRVDLPRDIDTQEAATVRLMFVCLTGEWRPDTSLGFTGQTMNTLAKSHANPDDSTETTSGFFKNLYENTLGKIEQALPTPEEKPADTSGTLLHQLLGSRTDSNPPSVTKSAPGDPASKPAPVEKPLTETKPEQPTSPSPPPSSPATVELLDPPPSYQPRSQSLNTSASEVILLPPPPGKG